MSKGKRPNQSAVITRRSSINNRFTFTFYFQALTRMLSSPSRFFGELPGETGLRQPLGFLIISGLFFAGASLTTISENQILMGGILLVNSVAMPFVTAGISFMVITMSMGKRMTFARLFSVYAYATGVTLLASWIPLFVWLTEPWKWMLIVIGLVKGCGFRWMQAILVVAVSIFVVVLSFWSLGPVLAFIKGALG
ncbi:MAG: YIP1 family protein [Deltaproteobacteria bacterium]|nr:YIP1 family protein [Deltaproteobacteria bacterium]